MSDVRQKAKDLLRLALDERTPENERNAATIQLLKLIDKYDLLSAGGKPINVASSILEKIAGLDIENVASSAEKFASSVERIMAASQRVAGRATAATESSEPRRRRRR
jgi:hypothetical protein